jgi:hypothetical protein
MCRVSCLVRPFARLPHAELVLAHYPISLGFLVVLPKTDYRSGQVMQLIQPPFRRATSDDAVTRPLSLRLCRSE